MTTPETSVKSPKKEKKEKEPKPALTQQISVTPDGEFVLIRLPKRLVAKHLFSF